MSDENKGLARKFVEQIWTVGNENLADELLSNDFVRHEPGEEGPFRGRESFKERVRFYRTAFPDLVVKIDDLVAEGDKVAIRWTAQGTQRGALGEIPASNRRFVTSGCGILRIRDGKIVEDVESWDTLGFMQQLGAIP